jgi:ectoine hydroxylase-related dioxygenase (phytanoyl-CoA dioxygenase family)
MRLTPQQIENFHSDGFLILDDYFTAEELEILRDETKCVFGEDTPRKILEKSGAVRSVFASHTNNEVFQSLARLPRLVRPAEQLLGSRVYIHQFKINAKVALEGEQWEWHQDFLYWHKEDGMPTPRVLTAAIFLQDVNDFNGPMLVIPGSHREMVDVGVHEKHLQGDANGNGNGNKRPLWMPTLTADLKYKIDKNILSALLERQNIFSAKGAAGFVLLFHGNMFHASSNNLSPRDRVSVFVTYNSVENALAPVASPRPEFIASRDFRPVRPIEDDALLGLAARV